MAHHGGVLPANVERPLEDCAGDGTAYDEPQREVKGFAEFGK
jgi:hypothetical protein